MSNQHLSRSELIACLADKFNLLPSVSDQITKTIIYVMNQSLSGNNRIEVRRFGSFEVRTYPSRIARNPKTDEVVKIDL